MCGIRGGSRAGALLAAACACARSRACSVDAAGLPRFVAPPPGTDATVHNGVKLDQVCFNKGDPALPFHVFVIGDWGGRLLKGEVRPKPANDTHKTGRIFVTGADDWAQQRVAGQMKSRALLSRPDYVLNVGDNFYWAGVEAHCGLPLTQHVATRQWTRIFESVYAGPGLDGKQWLGVLGNHDYGGYHFTNAWDQTIGYTWAAVGSHRWMTPAQYWSVQVSYPGFLVDYYFVDTNVFDVFDPNCNPEHNICSLKHNHETATCGVQGPKDVWSCPEWFNSLWSKEQEWLDRELGASRADWQILVTHFPPDFAMDYWKDICAKHGIDLIVTGHRHAQEVHSPTDVTNLLRPTAYIVSGGGGGITSEYPPSLVGVDDQYGFMDLTLSKGEIKIEAISHGGVLRSTTLVHPRLPGTTMPPSTSTTTQTTTTSSASTATTPLAVTTTRKTEVAQTTSPSGTTNATLTRLPPPATTTALRATSATRSTSATVGARTTTPPTTTTATSSTASRGHQQRTSPDGLDGMSFKLLDRGFCDDVGMLPVVEAAECAAAANKLNLRGVAVRTMNTAERIQGCFYCKGIGRPALWLSTDPREAALGVEPVGMFWQLICKSQARDKTLKFV